MGLLGIFGGNALDKLSEQGLNVTKRVVALAIDEPNQKWGIVQGGGGGKARVHSFSEIVAVEITENGEKYRSQNGVMRALVGGAIFGGVGALVGAGTAQKARTVSCLLVDVTLNSLDCPMESLVVIAAPTKTDSFVYKQNYENVKKMAAALMAMQRIASAEER